MEFTSGTSWGLLDFRDMGVKVVDTRLKREDVGGTERSKRLKILFRHISVDG
jgi:hypothetical protein